MSNRSGGNPLQRLPLPALLPIVAALWVVLQLVFSDRPVTPVTVLVDAAGGIVFASILTVVVGLRRRRLGGADASVDYLRAVRSGSLPADVDTSRWGPELDRSARAAVRQRWFIRIGSLLPFGLGLWGTTEADARTLGVLLAALAVAAVVVGEVSSRRLLARVARLRAAIAS
jgi:hypothetical protein